jgi:hypothetical protein
VSRALEVSVESEMLLSVAIHLAFRALAYLLSILMEMKAYRGKFFEGGTADHLEFDLFLTVQTSLRPPRTLLTFLEAFLHSIENLDEVVEKQGDLLDDSLAAFEIRTFEGLLGFDI